MRIGLAIARVEQIFREAARDVEEHDVFERLSELLDPCLEHLECAVEDPWVAFEHAGAGFAEQLDRRGVGRRDRRRRPRPSEDRRLTENASPLEDPQEDLASLDVLSNELHRALDHDVEIARRIAAVIDDLVTLEASQLRLREQLDQLRVGELVHRQAVSEASRDRQQVRVLHVPGSGYAARQAGQRATKGCRPYVIASAMCSFARWSHGTAIIAGPPRSSACRSVGRRSFALSTAYPATPKACAS